MRDAATVIIVSSYLIYKNVYLFSIALVVIPLMAFLMIAVVRRVKKLQVFTQESTGRFISNINEMKSGMRTTKWLDKKKQRLFEFRHLHNPLDRIHIN